MTESERKCFIERMEERGDIWEDDDVKRVYGDKSLQEAIDDRLNDINVFANIINSVIGR